MDIAAHDLLGRALGVSVATLLGGALTDRVPSYYSTIVGDPDETAARVADHMRRFWAPSMRERLAEEAAQDESGSVTAVVKTALELL